MGLLSVNARDIPNQPTARKSAPRRKASQQACARPGSPTQAFQKIGLGVIGFLRAMSDTIAARIKMIEGHRKIRRSFRHCALMISELRIGVHSNNSSAPVLRDSEKKRH